ncbi:hypothetical protein J437_LFUL013015 [Ladona fulva]|uniref:Uncharacterized protein n=1 Tax=Ladona fulva TaxID=123851 RepID=A0A8K0P652_LADFU|nr:hypothetical protein J437_LFUL013015 [Ladona fulva]
MAEPYNPRGWRDEELNPQSQTLAVQERTSILHITFGPTKAGWRSSEDSNQVSKQQYWKELCEEIDNDPQGQTLQNADEQTEELLRTYANLPDNYGNDCFITLSEQLVAHESIPSPINMEVIRSDRGSSIQSG